MDVFVYGLIDPRTKLIRYIGRTTQGSTRFTQHRSSRNRTKVDSWIKSLKSKGLEFEHVILEITDAERLNECEKWWIAYGKALGWSLTNLTNGGDGVPGYVPTAETRQKLRERMTTPEAIAANKALHTGRKRSPETKARIGAASKRRVTTDEARRNMSIAGRARPPKTQATRDKLSASHKGKKLSPAHVENMAAARRGKTASEETRRRMSEAHKARWAALKSSSQD